MLPFETLAVLIGLALGCLVVGVGLWVAKRRSGVVLSLIGIGWLFTMGLYGALEVAGLYGKVGEAGGYVANAVGVILMIVGIGGAYYVVKGRRGGS